MGKTAGQGVHSPNSFVLFSIVNKTSSEEFFVYTDGEGQASQNWAYIFPHGFHQFFYHLSDAGTGSNVVSGMFSSHFPSLRMCVLV